ncbi:MAG: SCP2 sterol-binding domain-containing protein [Alphaproteobacteria bacterium]|nr:SCP2 sterol-binding domain-containing protein [Alphaproteobacteria bacterium]
MTLEDLKKTIMEKLSLAPPLGARMKFDCGPDGLIMLDGTKSPPELSTEDGEAETTLICTADTLRGIAQGSIDPTLAYMTGNLKIEGSMGYALKLAGILSE